MNQIKPVKAVKPTKASTLYQANVLSERYFDVFMGDWTSVFFLIFQPLAVAICIGLVWQGGRTTDTLYFVMIFSTIFFGCVNSCREIVKESAIFARERLVGLDIWPYILSKIWVLGILGLGQTILFYLGIRFFLSLEGNPLLCLITLYASLLAGTALGMVISALVTTDVMALALVPVCLIPQLLFSKLVMPSQNLTGIVAWIEKITLVKWSHQAMEQVTAQSIDWGPWFQGVFFLMVITLSLVLASTVLLKFKDFK